MSGVHFTPRGLGQAEMLGLFRAFPLYVRLPKDRWPEVEKAESDDETYRRLMEEYSRLK